MAPTSSSGNGGAVSTERTVERSAGALMGTHESEAIHSATCFGLPTVADRPIR